MIPIPQTSCLSLSYDYNRFGRKVKAEAGMRSFPGSVVFDKSLQEAKIG